MKVSDKLYCLMLTCIYCAVYVHTICSCNWVLSGLVPYCESKHWFSEWDQYVASPILPIWCCHKAPVALLSIEITTWNMSVNLYFITSRWRPWGVWVHTNYSHRLTNFKYGNQWNNSTDFLSTDSQQGSGLREKLIYTLLQRKILPATHSVELNFSHICIYLILNIVLI